MECIQRGSRPTGDGQLQDNAQHRVGKQKADDQLNPKGRALFESPSGTAASEHRVTAKETVRRELYEGYPSVGLVYNPEFVR